MHNFTQFSIFLQYLLLGEEASPSIGNTLWRVSTMFTRSAITLPEVNGFGLDEIWGTQLAMTDFGCDPRRSESGRPYGSFVFFLSAKQRTTLPISGQPNFPKFAHKTWFCEIVNPFGIIF